MPRYVVTMPDGKKYAINGPEGATKEQVIAAVQRRIGAEEQGDTTLRGEIREAVKGIVPGAAGLLETAATGAAALLPEEQEMAVRAKAAELAGAARESFKAAPGYEDSTGRKFGEALGSTAPFFALGPLGAAGRLGAVGLGVGAGAGEARQRAEMEGGEEDKGLATAAGAVIGASEAFPVFNFIKRLPRETQLTMLDRIKRGFQAAGEEGAQEAAAQIGQNLIARGIYKPSQELFESAGEEGAYGAGVGAFIQVLTDMALGRRARPVQPPPPSAEEKLAAPPAPPTAPPGTQASAQEDISKQADIESTLKQAISDEDAAREEARLEREAIQAYEREREDATRLEAAALDTRTAEEMGILPEEQELYDAQTLREAAEAEALAPVDEDIPYTPADTGVEDERDAGVAAEIDSGAGGRGAELPALRLAAEEPSLAEPERAGLDIVSDVTERAADREEVVPDTLSPEDQRRKDVDDWLAANRKKRKPEDAKAVDKVIDHIRMTGNASAVAIQQVAGIPMSRAQVLREALIGSGTVVPVPGKKSLYTVPGKFTPTQEVRRVEETEEAVDDAAIEAARDRAAARLRARSTEVEAAQAAADVASERAPAAPVRPTFRGLPAGTLAEDTRRAFAALEAEQAAAQQPKAAEAQQGLDLLGGVAKPSLSSAETAILNDIKSAARFLNASGRMNDQDRATFNAEVRKPKPNLVKLRKLVDTVSAREEEEVSEVEPNETFYEDREQYELDENNYFYDPTGPEKFKPLRFERGRGAGMSADKVSQIVKRLTSGWKNAPKVNVVQSIENLPKSLRDRVFDDAKGFYLDGQVWIIADNASTEASVKANLFHEALGHFGLRTLFGRRMRETMLDIYRTNPAMRKAAERWIKANPTTYAQLGPEIERAMAIEEVLAEASSQGPIKDGGIRAAFNRVAALIRKFLRGMGISVNYSNNDIRQILIEAHDAVTTQRRERDYGDGTTAFERKRSEERLSSVFDVNLTAPRYNSEIGDGVRGALGRVKDSLRDGAISFLSIPQIAEIWAPELPAAEKLDILLGKRGATEMARREEVSTNVTKWFELSNKYQDNPEKLDMFFKVANMTTVYQVDPLSAEMRKVLNKPKSDMTKFDRVAYDIITEFDRLDPELRKAYKDLRKEYEDKRDQLFALMEKRLGKDVVDRLKAKYDSKRLQVYLPLWRSGNYWLTYTDKNGETITSAYASDIDRNRAREIAAADGGKDFQDFMRLRDARQRGAPPTGFLGDVVREMESKGAPQDMVDAVYETFLNYLPADSIRQQLQSREKSYDMATGVDRYGMFGFEPDVFQAYANVATRMANQLTNLEYAIPLEETMKELKKQAGGEKPTNPTLAAVYNNLENQVNFIRYPEKNWLIDGASYFSYLWFIAGNISSALVNTTQLPMVVMPLLGGKYGPTKTFAAMDRAMSKYFNGGWDTNNAGKGAFPSDFTFGAAANIDPKYKKLYDAAVSRSIIRRSTGYEITELQKTGVKDYVGTKARVTHGLGWVFQNSERFNREVTLLAAFDLAYEKSGNVDAAIEEAIRLVNDAHGSALAETGPRIFQQGFGKVMFTFKRFAQAQIYLLAKLYKQAFKDADPTTREVARSQLLGIFGSAFLIAGLQGMPMYGAVEFLANLIMGDDDEPYDFTAYVDKKFGETGRKGLLNQIIGVDVATRTGFNGLLWRDDPKRMSEVGPFLYALEQAMGPAYGAFLSGQRGYELFKEGEYQRSIEALTPSFVRNGFKALRFAQEGARNKDGTPIVEDISGYNVMMQAVGFTPRELSAKREEASIDAQLDAKLKARKQALVDQYAAAWMEKDREGVREALREIRAFSKKNPMKPYYIGPDTLYKSILDRRMKQKASVNGLYLSPTERYRVEQLKSGG